MSISCVCVVYYSLYICVSAYFVSSDVYFFVRVMNRAPNMFVFPRACCLSSYILVWHIIKHCLLTCTVYCPTRMFGDYARLFIYSRLHCLSRNMQVLSVHACAACGTTYPHIQECLLRGPWNPGTCRRLGMLG